MSATVSQRLGRMGEEAVMVRYIRAGFTLIGRNVRQYPNEIDLILSNDTHLVFVEVKCRHAVPGVRSRYGRPADAVNQTKRAHVIEAAKAYLRAHPTTLQPRIDVAEVYLRKGIDGEDIIQEIKVYPAAYAGR